jgi:hypothetical protein
MDPNTPFDYQSESNPYINQSFNHINASNPWEKTKEKVGHKSVVNLFLIDTESFEGFEKVKNIELNNSLLNLENCFRNMFEMTKHYWSKHLYLAKNNRFTDLFGDFFSGISTPIVVGTVSPFEGDLDDSLRTLRILRWNQNAVTP